MPLGGAIADAKRILAGRASVQIDADTGPLNRDLQKLKGTMQRRLKGMSMAKWSHAALGLSKYIGIAGAALQGIQFGLSNSFAQAADESAKMAREVGVGAYQLEQMRYAGQRMGVPIQNLNKGFERMGIRISEAAGRGRDRVEYALEQINLRAEELMKLKPSDQFFEIADAMKDIKNQSKRLEIAGSLMGRGQTRMVNILQAGGDELRELMKRYRDLAPALDYAQAERYADALLDLKKAFSGLKNQVGQLLSYSMVGKFEKLTNMVANLNQKLAQTNKEQSKIGNVYDWATKGLLYGTGGLLTLGITGQVGSFLTKGIGNWLKASRMILTSRILKVLGTAARLGGPSFLPPFVAPSAVFSAASVGAGQGFPVSGMAMRHRPEKMTMLDMFRAAVIDQPIGWISALTKETGRVYGKEGINLEKTRRDWEETGNILTDTMTRYFNKGLEKREKKILGPALESSAMERAEAYIAAGEPVPKGLRKKLGVRRDGTKQGLMGMEQGFSSFWGSPMLGMKIASALPSKGVDKQILQVNQNQEEALKNIERNTNQGHRARFEE